VPGGAAALARALAPQRIALRDCASFGLPDHVRIAACSPPDQERLIAAIGAVRVEATA
jgi:histidinol-phosphate/aromatic aminotransferase/cobyric acid decarboxylase-like protein